VGGGRLLKRKIDEYEVGDIRDRPFERLQELFTQKVF